MSISISVPGAQLLNPPFALPPASALGDKLANFPGLDGLLIADYVPLGLNPVAVRDVVSGRSIFSTLTRSPAVVDGGAGWNNRRVFDGTGVPNSNFVMSGWEKKPARSILVVWEKTASQHYLFQSLDDKFEGLVDGGGILRFRTNATDAASQVTLSMGAGNLGKQIALFCFDASDMSAAIYLTTPGVPAKTATFALDAAVSGDLWLFNSGASNGLLGKFPLFLSCGYPLHKEQFTTFRERLFADVKAHYAIA